MLSRGVRRSILASKDPALPFRALGARLSSANITFINLESPFSDQGPYHEDGLVFHAAPPFIAGLKLAGVDVASTANNHARDCGEHGVTYTISELSRNGIQAVGSAEIAKQSHAGVIVTRQGVRFGFLAYTYDQQNGNWRDLDDRIAMAEPGTIQTDVRGLLARTDVVIVSLHHGIEYTLQPSKAQVECAHAAIDAGAALVIGHHPHVVQPREIYKGREIYYSLGNFVFDQFQRVATQHGEMVDITFEGPVPVASEVIPIRITPTGPELEQVRQ
jgi:gamma-polyglutamate biosynthesis protein CapA